MTSSHIPTPGDLASDLTVCLNSPTLFKQFFAHALKDWPRAKLYISSQEQKKIFQLFEQIEQSNADVFQRNILLKKVVDLLFNTHLKYFFQGT